MTPRYSTPAHTQQGHPHGSHTHKLASELYQRYQGRLSGDGQNDQQDQDDDLDGNANVHVTDLRFLFDLVGMFRFRLQRCRGNVHVRIQVIQQPRVDFRFFIDRKRLYCYK